MSDSNRSEGPQSPPEGENLESLSRTEKAIMSKGKRIETVLVMFFKDSYPFCVSSQRPKTRDNTMRDANGSRQP
jgi:hypothetical protein